jgi:cobalt/nickel transport system permease protein
VHIPDGFVDAPTSLAAAGAAAAGVAVALRRAGSQLDERRTPLAGLTAAFVFAVQMVNFPVASGTSGHLMGGTLAAVLLGPWVASLCLTVVLSVQALLFADGGLSALGLNIVLMGFVCSFAGYGAYRLLRWAVEWSLAPSAQRQPGAPARTALSVAAGIGAWAGVVATAVAFTLVYAVGGQGDVDLTAVLWSMVGVHSLIGIGEGVLTALTVGAVAATRPDLIAGYQPPVRTRQPKLAVVGGGS